MRRLEDLLVTCDDIYVCLSAAKTRVDNTYSRAYSNVVKVVNDALSSKVVEQATEIVLSNLFELEEMMRNRNLSSVPTRLEKYFFSKLRVKNGAIEGLTPEKVQVYGFLIEKSWQTGFPETDPCLDNHLLDDKPPCNDCDQYDQYYVELNKILDTLVVRDDQLVAYSPRHPSETFFYPSRSPKGKWSNNVILPVGIFIERPALDYLIGNDMNDGLCDVKGRLVVARW